MFGPFAQLVLSVVLGGVEDVGGGWGLRAKSVEAVGVCKCEKHRYVKAETLIYLLPDLPYTLKHLSSVLIS